MKKKCQECNSNLIITNNNKLVCSQCGLVQDIENFENTRCFPDGKPVTQPTFVKGSQIILSKYNKTNKKLSRLANIHKNIGNNYRETLLRRVNPLLNEFTFIFNLNEQNRLKILNKFIRLWKKTETNFRYIYLLTTALYFHYNEANIPIGLHTIMKKLELNHISVKASSIFRVLTELKRKTKISKKKNQKVLRYYIDRIFESKEFVERVSECNLHPDNVKRVLIQLSNKDLSKLSRTEIIFLIYKTLKDIKSKIITYELLSRITYFSDSAIRNKSKFNLQQTKITDF
ncbi:MAG: hypothetical protein GF317_09845 [Candidatus Lokiarchaeota archaeon]|nr:hypothetical protein [Candidatus Lokiarchaeota archaeon]